MTELTETVRPSIGALVRAALEASDDCDALSVVDGVVAAIDPSDYEHYLRELLRARVSSDSGYLREKNAPVIRKQVSTKQSLIRDEYWPRFLRQRVSLPTGSKFLADVTVDDLRFLAGARRSQSDVLLSRAEEFTTLADLMVKSGAACLGQLDAGSGSTVLMGAL